MVSHMRKMSQTVFVVSQGRFDADPRHSYWCHALRKLGCNVIKVQIIDEGCPPRHRVSMSVQGDCWTVAVNRFATVVAPLRPPIVTSTGKYLELIDRAISEAVGLLSSAISDAAMVVAIDLLVARNIVARGRNTMVIYDAHEVFVESYDMLDTTPLSDIERLYWKEVERDVVRTAFATVTVSPGIADFMQEYTGVLPRVIPNYLPLKLRQQRGHTASRTGPVRFVYVGRADPFRGLDRLVSSWDFDPLKATLDLYITESPYKDRLLALSSEVLRSHAGPEFRKPVDPTHIPAVLASYEVGVIPYEYPPPYSEASPNKFGEYVAAGLSVISNGSGFVSQQIVEHSLGTIFDWTIPGTFVDAVEEMAALAKSGRLPGTSEAVFQKVMNWEVSSGPLIDDIRRTLNSMPPKRQCSPPHRKHLEARWSSAILSVILNPVFNLIRQRPRLRSFASHFFQLVNLVRR